MALYTQAIEVQPELAGVYRSNFDGHISIAPNTQAAATGLGYLEATVAYSLKYPEVGSDFRAGVRQTHGLLPAQCAARHTAFCAAAG